MFDHFTIFSLPRMGQEIKAGHTYPLYCLTSSLSMWLVIWKVVFSVLQPPLWYCWHFRYSKLSTEELAEVTSMASISLYFPALWPSKHIQWFTRNLALLLYCSAGLSGLPREIHGQLLHGMYMAVPKKAQTSLIPKPPPIKSALSFEQCSLQQISGISETSDLHHEGWSNHKASWGWWLNNKYKPGYYSRPWE